MFRRTLLNLQNFICNVTHQTRGFSLESDVNPVSKYFCQAKLIDSIRLRLRSGSAESLVPLLENPNLDSFVVVNAVRSAPSPEAALSFVEALKRVPSFAHTQHTLYAIAKILAKSGRSRQLKKLVDAINDRKFPKVRPVSFVDQMRWYATAGDIDLVRCVWEEFRAIGKRKCIEPYNIIMGLYVVMGKDLEAVQTFCSIMQEGALPNSRTFTIIIEHLLNLGYLEKAKEVFDLLPRMRIKRTRRQYSLLVEALLYNQQFEATKHLLREMKMEGVLPPISMLSVLQRMSEAGMLEDSDDFFKEMVPDSRIKNLKLCAGLDDGDNDEDVDEYSCEANVCSVQLKPWLDPSALASALSHWRDVDICALEDAKLVWTKRLVCKMIRHFKSPQTAWEFFWWVANQPGFVHDFHTYSGIITKLASHGKVDLVDNILLKLKNEGIKLTISMVKQILDFYGLSKEGDAALRIFHDVELLCDNISEFDTVLLYSSLLRTLLKCGRDHDTIYTIEQMFSKGIHPDAQTFSGLMYHFANRGDFKTVQKLYEMVRKSGLEPNSYMYKMLVRVYCKCGKATLALRLFEEMRNCGLVPDGETKSWVVKGLWKEGRLREASFVEETYTEKDVILPLPSTGQMFNVSSTDLLTVYKLYSGCFQSGSTD